MSFNRLSYDKCSYKADLNESVSYNSYMFDNAKYEHCSKCRPELGVVGGTSVSHPRGNLVDLENNLYGIDRPNTKCPGYKFLPSEEVRGKEYIKPVCHPKVEAQIDRHLRACQFAGTLEVPRPPQSAPFSCSRPAAATD
jgi:hypothetical protein